MAKSEHKPGAATSTTEKQEKASEQDGFYITCHKTLSSEIDMRIVNRNLEESVKGEMLIVSFDLCEHPVIPHRLNCLAELAGQHLRTHTLSAGEEEIQRLAGHFIHERNMGKLAYLELLKQTILQEIC